MTIEQSADRERPRRPLGITILSLTLAYLSLAGFGNTVLLLVVDPMPVPVPRWLAVFALAYGITTITASIRLWRMEATGLFWLRAWFVVLVLLNLAFATIPIFRDNAFGGVVGILGFSLGLVVFLWLLDVYVRRRLASASETRHQ